jgi:hypothetical protein
MLRNTPATGADQGDDGFDLREIFIGRKQELDPFEQYLSCWQQRMGAAGPLDRPVASAPSPNEKFQGLVVLLERYRGDLTL